MRIKLDENLPASVASALTALTHELHTVAEENLSGRKDHELWETAQQESLFLITQDLDFLRHAQIRSGTHSGILLVRLPSPDRSSLIQRIKQVFSQEEVAHWSGCFVVVSEHKVRVVRRVQ
jgi:predicted nuclease of predicted toxin-antitoxin system